MFNANPLLSPTSPTSTFQQQARFSSNNPFASTVAPAAPFAPRGPANLALNQTLEIFTKGSNDVDWGSIRMDPFDLPGGSGGPGGRRGHGRTDSSSSARPMSGYGLDAGTGGWAPGHGARMSVIIGDGAGGFLAVPGDGSGSGARRGSTASVGAMPHSSFAGFGGGGSTPFGGQDDWPRPGSSAGHKKKERDLWR